MRLLFEIYDRMLTLQTDHLETIAARDEPADVVLRAACVDVIETSIDFLLEGTVFFRDVHMLSQPRQQEVTRRRRQYHDTFAALLEKGQAEGLYRTDIPRGVLVAHFFADVHYLPTWFSTDGPETKEQVAAQLTELALERGRGLLPAADLGLQRVLLAAQRAELLLQLADAGLRLVADGLGVEGPSPAGQVLAGSAELLHGEVAGSDQRQQRRGVGEGVLEVFEGEAVDEHGGHGCPSGSGSLVMLRSWGIGDSQAFAAAVVGVAALGGAAEVDRSVSWVNDS